MIRRSLTRQGIFGNASSTWQAADANSLPFPFRVAAPSRLKRWLEPSLPRDGKLLILVNGAYGHRIAKICAYMNRAYVVSETPEDTQPDPNAIDAILDADADIGHVVIVHCETTSGILNPVAEIAAVVANRGRRLLIDAMSAFGAIPFDLTDVTREYALASSNKCFEGVPGIGFVICRKTALRWRQKETHIHAVWTCSINGKPWHATVNGASHRQRMSSSHCDRRWRRIGLRAASMGRYHRYSGELSSSVRGYAQTRVRAAPVTQPASTNYCNVQNARRPKVRIETSHDRD